MITWIIGENSFEARQALAAIEAGFDGTGEHVDGEALQLADLPELLMGVTLFAPERLVVIFELSRNGALWEKLPEWLPRISDTVHVVFVDQKPDKRTKSYKELVGMAEMHECPAWTERDSAKAEAWVMERTKSFSTVLTRPQARQIVERVGVDQWALANAADIVSLLDEVTPEAIEAAIPAQPSENIFQLFEAALKADAREVRRMLEGLRAQEDAYAIFALLGSQVISLAVVAYAPDGAQPAKDFGLHPFVVSKFGGYARRLGAAQVSRIVTIFADTDADLKRSRGEPWILLEKALLETVTIASRV